MVERLGPFPIFREGQPSNELIKYEFIGRGERGSNPRPVTKSPNNQIKKDFAPTRKNLLPIDRYVVALSMYSKQWKAATDSIAVNQKCTR